MPYNANTPPVVSPMPSTPVQIPSYQEHKDSRQFQSDMKNMDQRLADALNKAVKSQND